MNVLCLQHVPFETPGVIADWAIQRQAKLQVAHLYAGDRLPAFDDWDMLVVLGGPMSVHDEQLHPWMTAEKFYIEKAIRLHKHIIGVCLGAQLIAEALGATINQNPQKELGWHPVMWTKEALMIPAWATALENQLVFHWHGETFSLPEGAVKLAHSKACNNQSFAYGTTVLGFQFHLEMTAETIQALLDHCGSELDERGPFIQLRAQLLQDTRKYAGKTAQQMYAILDHFAHLVD